MSSVHDKLGRVRKPRVHLRYDVDTGGAVVKKELPFLMGVVGDFSGTPMKRQPDGSVSPVKLMDLEKRKFTNIDRDNFNEVFRDMTPGLALEVDNTIAGDGSTMKVNLAFESMDDLSPAKVAMQIEPLRKLLEIRSQLNELKTKADVSSNLEKILEEVLQNTENVLSLAGELGVKKDDGESK
jgi:type VI secretion system protein ImpB